MILALGLFSSDLISPGTLFPRISLAIRAHVGHSFPILRYAWTHVSWMASFLMAMSRTFLPPSSVVLNIWPMDIVGLFSLLHMKFRISFSRDLIADSGMPWTFTRYWVIPPMIICKISRLPSVVGWFASHLFRLVAIFSIVGVHGGLGPCRCLSRRQGP